MYTRLVLVGLKKMGTDTMCTAQMLDKSTGSATKLSARNTWVDVEHRLMVTPTKKPLKNGIHELNN